MMTDLSRNGWKTGKRERFYLALLLLIAGGFLSVSLNTQLNPDGILYFSYLRSVFFDRDILLVNEFNDMELLPLSRHVSATGLEGNPVAIGTSLLLLPFYAMAFLADRIGALAGFNLGDDGYRGVYACVFPFGSLFYGCLTGLMILAMVRKRFGQEYAVVALLQIMLGTPFLFYLAVHHQVSHLCSAFSVTLFLYAFETMRDDSGLADRYSPFFVLGAFSGIAILTRTQDGLFWIIPFCYLLFRLRRSGHYRRILGQGVSFLAGAVVAASPQLTLWKIMHGRWIHAPEAANINFFQPHFVEVLTSSYHGLLVWSPVILLSVIGLVLLARDDAGRGIPLLLAVLLQLVISGSMRMWWEGASFGLRLFVNCTPIFCLGLAAAYTRFRASWVRWLGGLFVFWTFLLYLNVVTGTMDLNRFYPLQELFRLQARQLTGLLSLLRGLDGYSGVFRSVGGAGILTVVVVLVMAALIRLRSVFPGALRHRLFSIYGVMGATLAGIGISGLIWLLGHAAHQHKQFWQEDLKRIESGLNSYSLFYIDYSFYIMHGDYFVAVGRLPEAADQYQKAIGILATPALYWRLAETLTAAGRYQEAGTAMQQALARWPEDPHLLRRAIRMKSLRQ
jgi:hypothetical protein